MTRSLKTVLVMVALVATTLVGSAPVADANENAPASAGDRWCC
jgi:hypothetical protein